MAATPARSNMDIRAFTLFPKFPTEVRLKIWEAYAMLQPRIVEICLIKGRVARLDSDDRNITNRFYSPTPLPQFLFGINSESRTVALKAYILSLSNAHHPAQIRWNPDIDMIFLPAWCFQRHIREFIAATNEEEKRMIQRLAFETLARNGCVKEGMINFCNQIDEFRNLREVVLVQRLRDSIGCGYCHYFDGPEEGVAGFREIWEREEDESEGEESSDEDEEEGEGGEPEVGVVERRKRRTLSEEAMEIFAAIHEKDRGYRIPSVRKVDLMRDGIRI